MSIDINLSFFGRKDHPKIRFDISPTKTLVWKTPVVKSKLPFRGNSRNILPLQGSKLKFKVLSYLIQAKKIV